MGLLKPRGQSADETRAQRKNTLHGSQPKREMAKWAGRLRRLDEKPGRWSTPRHPGPVRRWGR